MRQSFYLGLQAGLIIMSGRFAVEIFSACVSFILSLRFYLPDET